MQLKMALNAFSILAMVLQFNFARPLIDNFFGGNREDAFKKHLFDHIVRFSLNGIGAGTEEIRK
jgi:hypothetical protein